MTIDLEEFRDRLDYLFHPEPDDEGIMPREFPSQRLTKELGLNFDYMSNPTWEGSTSHEFTRLCPVEATHVHALTRNQDVPNALFGSALRLMADSILEYHNQPKRKGDLRFYPPVILTFWAGFEAYVRYTSELLIATAKHLPTEIARYLRDREAAVDARKGIVEERVRYQPVLDRYAVLLKHGYEISVDRGSKWWQGLEKARRLRDYYTHVDASSPRGTSCNEVMDYLESVLLAILVPSSQVQRSLMLGTFWLHEIWCLLDDAKENFVEHPFFMDSRFDDSEYLFHCNFDGVDVERFPNMREQRARDTREKPRKQAARTPKPLQ